MKGIEWDPRNKDAKTAHAKGIMAFDKDGGFWITHSTPGFPRNSTLFDGWYFAWAERKFAQAFMCTSLGNDALNSVAGGMAISHPYVQEYDIPEGLKSHFPTVYDWVKEDYYQAGNSTQVVKTRGGTDIHVIEHYDNPHTDLWDDLVAPYLNTNLHVETFCQCDNSSSIPGSNCGFHCCQKSICKGTKNTSDHTIQQIELMQVTLRNGTTRTWDSNWTHAKWGFSTDHGNTEHYVCIGDQNRQHEVPSCAAGYGGMLDRGGGAACIRNENMWKTLHSFVQKDECNMP